MQRKFELSNFRSLAGFANTGRYFKHSNPRYNVFDASLKVPLMTWTLHGFFIVALI